MYFEVTDFLHEKGKDRYFIELAHFLFTFSANGGK